MAPSTTGSIALREAEVQPPKTAATWSSVSSLLIFSAKTVGSLWPSSSTNSICLPRMPPSALISSAASMSESRTVCSLMAIAPDVEFRKPSLTVSPSTQVSRRGLRRRRSSAASSDESLSSPHALTSNAKAAMRRDDDPSGGPAETHRVLPSIPTSVDVSVGIRRGSPGRDGKPEWFVSIDRSSGT